jgi:DNA-binding MarR family transcriptional regulator
LKPTDAGAYSSDSEQGHRQWTFLNNHAHVLLCLARNPDMVLREVAMKVGITERATQKIIKDLVECQVLERYRVGRCNSYRINLDTSLRHTLERQHTVGELLALLLTDREMARVRSQVASGTSKAT